MTSTHFPCFCQDKRADFGNPTLLFISMHECCWIYLYHRYKVENEMLLTSLTFWLKYTLDEVWGGKSCQSEFKAAKVPLKKCGKKNDPNWICFSCAAPAARCASVNTDSGFCCRVTGLVSDFLCFYWEWVRPGCPWAVPPRQAALSGEERRRVQSRGNERRWWAREPIRFNGWAAGCIKEAQMRSQNFL